MTLGPPRPFVVDASVSLAWVFEDEADAATDELLERVSVDDVHVPGLWRLEVANALVMAERRTRIPQGKALTLLNDLMSLPITVAPTPDWSRTLHIAGWAQTMGLSSCDAASLDLAAVLRVPLATRDQRLAGACREIGVPVLPEPA